jgi:AraC-like DNA-binding protein
MLDRSINASPLKYFGRFFEYRTDSMDTRIARTLTYIDEHLEARLTIDMLSAAADLSPSRFAHLFRHEVGTSPARYVHALRMLRARVLLERSFLSIKEVMALVGCHDPSHFSRDFRWFHGAAPRHYRLGASREAHDAGSPAVGSHTEAAIAQIAALANQRRTRTRKPRPRARAPDGAPGTRAESQGSPIVNEPGGGVSCHGFHCC